MSTDRVTQILVKVDEPVVRALVAMVDGRDHVRTGALVQLTAGNHLSRVSTTFTGTPPSRHRGFISFVPDSKGDPRRSEALTEAGLRPRTARDLGASVIWDRLASRRIASLVLGLPFQESPNDPSVLELGGPSLADIAREERKSMPEVMLDAIRKAIGTRPDIRCIILHSRWNETEDEPTDDEVEEHPDQDDDSVGTGEATVEIEAQDRAADLLAWLDTVWAITESRHMMVTLVSSKSGKHLMFGSRCTELPSGGGRLVAVAPTVFDLLDEPAPVDLADVSLLGTSRQAGSTVESPSWAVEEQRAEAPDFDPLVDRAVSGEGGALLRAQLQKHLLQELWAFMHSMEPAGAVKVSRQLLALDRSSESLLRLALALFRSGSTAEAIEQAERLRREHPESQAADIVLLVGRMGAGEQARRAVLERHPFSTVRTPLAKSLWARSSAQIGSQDDAIKAFTSLMGNGQMLNQDRLQFASLLLNRNASGDAARAFALLRGLTGIALEPGGAPRVAIPLMRARALHIMGKRHQAISSLERFLEHHPHEARVSGLLEKLRSDASPVGDGSG